MTPTSTPSQEPTDDGPLLRIVHIRAGSSREVQRLRQMSGVDIARVRPDPERPPGEGRLSGGFVVEAFVSRGVLNKLTAMGFDISRVPPRN
jgi:hypothetical protein